MNAKLYNPLAHKSVVHLLTFSALLGAFFLLLYSFLTCGVCSDAQDVFNETRSILEPAGAVGVAGAKAWLKHNKHKVSLFSSMLDCLCWGMFVGVPSFRKDKLRSLT